MVTEPVNAVEESQGLCGAGVALKLVQALGARGTASKTPADDLFDLAALATVGDVAPLVDENRRLVREGRRLRPGD